MFLFFLAIISFTKIIISKEIKQKSDIFIISILGSFLSYLVIASKVIYIHNYYNIFLIIPILISLYVLINKIRKVSFYIYFIVSIIITTYFLFISKIKVLEIMSFYRINYIEIKEYVKNNTNSFNRCIYSINTYSYYAPIIDSEEINGNQILESKEFVSDVNILGLENTLKKYNINCFIQEKSENNYKDFFTNIYGTKIIFNKSTREEIIKGKKQNLIDNKNYIEQLELNINYNLIKETQNFKIYLLN